MAKQLQSKEQTIAAKIAQLQTHYKRVWFEDGRLCVEVDDSKADPEYVRLSRRVWGNEWPIVRSAAWREDLQPEQQLQFASHG